MMRGMAGAIRYKRRELSRRRVGEAEGENEARSMKTGRVYGIWDVSRSTGEEHKNPFLLSLNLLTISSKWDALRRTDEMLVNGAIHAGL